ncbi:hypothetical protein MKX01_000822 [Papaver californicum]|nr:hypothetical protein MKX01_000822 [Papaver californicum]
MSRIKDAFPVFRNVDSPQTSSLSGKQFTSLGSRAYRSKADQSDPSAQNQTKKLPDCSLTKVVFKYVCASDEFQDDNRPFTPLIRKVLEIYRGHTFFEYKDGDHMKSAYGVRVSKICFVEASLFKEHIRSIMDSAADALNIEDLMIDHIETMTIDDDKHLLVIIMSELKRNGFHFSEDSMTLQKIVKAVERAKTRMTNTIKLNLPVPAGEPDMSTIISWGKCADLPILESCSVAPNFLTVRHIQ